MQIIVALLLTAIAAALLLVILMGIFYAVDFFLELPYVGAKKESIAKILDLANLKAGETVVDLGSGDGRLLFESAALGAFAVGYEINPFLVALSKLKSKLSGTSDRVKIKNESIWKADLKVADVIFVYSLIVKMKKFEDFVYKNARKSTRVIVNTNPFLTKKPIKSKDKIFLYKI